MRSVAPSPQRENERLLSSDQILFTKLGVPAVPAQMVSRARLDFEEGSARVILVCAPAGYGKTTLVASWANGRESATVWLSLDTADNDPVRFLMHFTAAIQSRFPEFGTVIVEMLESSPPPPIANLMRSLVNQIYQLPERLSLVLDDLHLLTNPAVHEAIAFLIEHQPDRFQLVIASRNDPPFSLARLRAQRHLLEFRAMDLRFKPDEARIFCNEVMQSGLDPEQVDALMHRTEGWITGLQLAALSLRNNPDKRGFINDFAGDDRHITDFLLDEVLRGQSQDLQDFLLYTSILERFNAALCDALTGRSDSRDVIDDIERTNLFVIGLDRQRSWFRYHHLFTSLLKNRLKLLQPEMLNVLHSRASRWLSCNNFITEAINHALAGEDFEFAADLMEQHGHQLFSHGRINAALTWAEKLSKSLVAKRPVLSMTCAWACFYMDNLAGLEHHVNAAGKCLENCTDAPPGSKERALLGQVALMRGCHFAFSGKIDAAIAHTIEALASFSPERTMYRAAGTILGVYYLIYGKLDQALPLLEENANIAAARHNILIPVTATLGLARLHLLQGRTATSRRIYEKAMRDCVDLGWQDYPACGILHIGLGELEFELNNLTEAEQHLSAGVEMAAIGMRYMNTWGRVLLARTRLALGMTVNVHDEQAEIAFRKYSGRFVIDLPPVSAAIARLWLSQNRLEAVQEWVEVAQLSETLPLAAGREAEYLVLVRFHMVSQKLTAAMDLLLLLWPAAERGARVAVMTELLVLKALILQATGKVYEALEALKQALHVAENSGLVSVFVHEGESIASLLKKFTRGSDQHASARRLLGHFLDEGVAGKAGAMDSLASQLSKKERQVAGHILQGASNQEIAVALFISPNTVSSHMKNIYSKLGVNSRAKAIDLLRKLSPTV
ncbi:LuxR C-terminal-related transcriptional regulator [soil metagenome]